jgi:hypothetical protein
LFAKFKHLIIIIVRRRQQQQQHNTHHSDPKVVENDKKKDFAKFKEEEDNTAHSNSKGTYIHTNPKSYIILINFFFSGWLHLTMLVFFFVATILTEQEKVFEFWCYCFNKIYSNQAEKNMRFRIFQKTLASAEPVEGRFHNSNALTVADRTQDELDVMYPRHRYGYSPEPDYICPSDIDQMPTYAGIHRHDSTYTFDESDDDECWDELYWDEECSDLESDQDDQQSFHGTL